MATSSGRHIIYGLSRGVTHPVTHEVCAPVLHSKHLLKKFHFRVKQQMSKVSNVNTQNLGVSNKQSIQL